MRMAIVMFLTLILCPFEVFATLNYPILYVRSVRSDTVNKMLPDFFHPLHIEPGTSIMYLPANSSTPQVFVDGGTDGAAFDPVVSFDGTKVAYVFCPDVVTRNAQKQNLPEGDCNIYEKTAPNQGGSVTTTQLTFSEWEPTASGETSTANLGYGVYNMGPAYLPGNKLMFVTSRQGYLPNKPFTDVNLQLWVLDLTTGIQQQIAPMNIGSALHPTVLMDGTVAFTSYEAQGVRDRRLWGVWRIYPDGRNWGPIISAFQRESGVHPATQLSDGSICATWYYNKNNRGFGTLNCLDAPGGVFGSPAPANNTAIQQGYTNPSTPRMWKYSFSPAGLVARTPFASEMDEDSELISSVYVGKATHPRGAPGNDMLLAYCKGECNHNPAPSGNYYDSDIYIVADSVTAEDVTDMTLVIGTTTYNEWWPVPLVPYEDIYGVEEPTELAWLPDSTHSSLLTGTPFGLVGTSSLYKRDSKPGTPTAGTVEHFNVIDAAARSNWIWQGSDVGYYSNSDIEYIRIIVMQGTSDVDDGTFPYQNAITERVGILGDDIAVRHPGSGNDPDGNPDTSFLVKIPADMPFSFQMLDAQHRVLTMAQTWHQVRPGEIRTNCGGCHAHSQSPTSFASTVAGQSGYTPTDRSTAVVKTYEYVQDIRPILANNCTSCHGGSSPSAGLKLDTTSNDANGYPNDFNRLANDQASAWGPDPPAGTGSTWKTPNVSAYVRVLQSRRSLLGWRLYNARLDGIANGDVSTDIDFAAAVNCTAHTISDADKRIIMAWIDTGASGGAAVYTDELKPTIHLAAGDLLRLGMVDAHSGLDMDTLEVLHDSTDVTSSVTATSSTGIWEVTGESVSGTWQATVCDNEGNCQTRKVVVP